MDVRASTATLLAARDAERARQADDVAQRAGTAEPVSDPFDTKGGSVFVASLESMVLTRASRSALGNAVARGRQRRVEPGAEAGRPGTGQDRARGDVGEARAS